MEETVDVLFKKNIREIQNDLVMLSNLMNELKSLMEKTIVIDNKVMCEDETSNVKESIKKIIDDISYRIT